MTRSSNEFNFIRDMCKQMIHGIPFGTTEQENRTPLLT